MDTTATPTPRPRRRNTSALPVPTPSESRFEALVRAYARVADDAGAKAPNDEVPAGVNDATTDRAVDVPLPDTASTFLHDLYARKDEFRDRDPYATIGSAFEFNTKIVGVSFEGRQGLIAGLKAGDVLDLVREADNEKDPNAIAVHYGALHIGFVRAPIAKRLAPIIDGGERYAAEVLDRTGGGERHHGVNIRVTRLRTPPSRRPEADPRSGEGEADLTRALIGKRPIRDSQNAVLERIARGANTLAVLGTGRGKSFCYQLPAAHGALADGSKTLVIYPLRALANDQFEALRRMLGRTGLRMLRANGAISTDERQELMAALADGSWDIILSTPEFVQFHGEAFGRACNRPKLFVVDEAHHVHDARHRPAYAQVGPFVDSIGKPQVLALTATAGDTAFEAIRSTLNIDAWVIDPFVRENLHILEARNTADKNAYLRRVLDGDSKAIVYCNSRNEAMKVAEHLRVDSKRKDVAFYHAGMGAAERAGVEEYFRAGDIRVVVATSAFGEGIDLPDVRDVVLYHLNFNFTEFNQQAGRAGRDEAEARIHLLYGEHDRSLNEYILARTNPTIDTLRSIYRGVKELCSENLVRLSAADIAATLDIDRVSTETIGAAVSIFEEAGLAVTGRDDDGRYLLFVDVSGKVDLSKTTRFAEGVAERESFDGFCSLALKAEVEVLERIVNRPIYPERIAHLFG